MTKVQHSVVDFFQILAAAFGKRKENEDHSMRIKERQNE
jgi:hypothetical protein